jgi:Flp pilus assembly pilin Flp
MQLAAPPALAATHRERGASLVEYALLVGGIAVVCLIGLHLLGGSGDAELATAATAIADHGAGSAGGAPSGNRAAGAGSDDTVAEQEAAEQTAVDAAVRSDAEREQAETALTATEGSAELYGWDGTAEVGEWKAETTFTNEWERPSFLTIEVVRVTADGRMSANRVSDVLVPANGTSTFGRWSNIIDTDARTVDVVAVRFEVVEIRTSDLDWTPRTYAIDGGAMSTAVAPRVE